MSITNELGSNAKLTAFTPKINPNHAINAATHAFDTSFDDFIHIYNGKTLVFDGEKFLKSCHDFIKSEAEKSKSNQKYEFFENVPVPFKGQKTRISTALDLADELNISKSMQSIEVKTQKKIAEIFQNNEHLSSNFNAVLYSEFIKKSFVESAPFIRGEMVLKQLELNNDALKSNKMLRIYSVEETIHEPKFYEKLTSGIRKYLYKQHSDQLDENDDLVENIEILLDSFLSKPETELHGFCDFFENSYLSRARIKNALQFMGFVEDELRIVESYKGNSSPAIQYIRNVIDLYYNFVSVKQNDSNTLSVSMVYNTKDLNFTELLSSAYAFNALPTWLKPSVQHSEGRDEDGNGFSFCREVNYAFKTNGFVNETHAVRGKKVTAFENRLDSIRMALMLSDDDIRQADWLTQCAQVDVKFEIYQLILLYIALDVEKAHVGEGVQNAFDHISDRFERDGITNVLREMLDELARKANLMKIINSDILKILNNKSSELVQKINTNGSLDQSFHVNKSIVNEDLFFLTCEGDKHSVLLKDKSEGMSYQSNDARYYNHLHILTKNEADNSISKSSICKFELKTSLKVKDLVDRTPTEAQLKFKIGRQDLNILPIAIVPKSNASNPFNTENYCRHSLFNTFNVLIQYSGQNFKDFVGPKSNINNADDKGATLYYGENLLALNSFLFTLGSHLLIKHLAIYTLKVNPELNNQLYIPLLRVDSSLKENYRPSTNSYGVEADRVYAISYALERLLSGVNFGGSNFQVMAKTQGIGFKQPLSNYLESNIPFNSHLIDFGAGTKYRVQSSYQSLSGYMPLTIPFEGDLDSIALISYGARPENEFNSFKSFDMYKHIPAGFGYYCYVYVLKRVSKGSDQGVLTLKDVRSISVLEDEFSSSKEMIHIIESIKNENVQEIIMLSHHFANRKVGKTQTSNLIHESEMALDSLDSTFPDVNFYPIQCEFTSAINLNDNVYKGNAAFEIPHYVFHSSKTGLSQVKQSLPIYSFSTQKSVGNELKSQLGICTYSLITSVSKTSLYFAKRLRIMNSLVTYEPESVVMKAVRSICRGLHYFESEKPLISSTNMVYRPVLDHFHVGANTKTASLSEVSLINRERLGEVIFSLYPLMAKLDSYSVNQKWIGRELSKDQAAKDDKPVESLEAKQ